MQQGIENIVISLEALMVYAHVKMLCGVGKGRVFGNRGVYGRIHLTIDSYFLFRFYQNRFKEIRIVSVPKLKKHNRIEAQQPAHQYCVSILLGFLLSFDHDLTKSSKTVNRTEMP